MVEVGQLARYLATLRSTSSCVPVSELLPAPPTCPCMLRSLHTYKVYQVHTRRQCAAMTDHQARSHRTDLEIKFWFRVGILEKLQGDPMLACCRM